MKHVRIEKKQKKQKHRTDDIGIRARHIADHEAEKHCKTRDGSDFNVYWLEVYNQTLMELTF